MLVIEDGDWDSFYETYAIYWGEELNVDEGRKKKEDRKHATHEV